MEGAKRVAESGKRIWQHIKKGKENEKQNQADGCGDGRRGNGNGDRDGKCCVWSGFRQVGEQGDQDRHAARADLRADLRRETEDVNGMRHPKLLLLTQDICDCILYVHH